MSAPATPLSAVREDDAACALGRARALIEPQLRLLGRLAEIGLEVAEGVGRQVRGEDPPVKADPSLAFARVSRAVRLTVALQSKLVDGLAALEAGLLTADPAAPRPDPDYILKARVERIVERAAEAEHDDDACAVDALVAEAGDRLDDIDLYGDLLDRPVSEILARICADIGLSLDWSRLAQEAWARTEVRDGRAGAALIQALGDPPPPLDEAGSSQPSRRAARLAVTARRGRRAEAARARGDPAAPTSIKVTWIDPAPRGAPGAG